MAKIDWVEARLLRWAEVVTSGRDGSGYAAMNVLHPQWSPPAPGQSPTMKTSIGLGDVRATHAMLARLTMRQRNTVVVHYCLRLPLAEQAQRLDCAERTVLARVEAVHRLIASMQE